MTTTPTRTLPNGDEIPAVGFGTYALSDEEVTEAVPVAIDAGYTHIDTAEGYENEAALGDVLADYDREDLFVTSKVLPPNLHYESLLESLSDSLERLGTDYLDLYLIHWPNPAISLRETIGALEQAHEEGLVRNIGVSNFSTYQLRFARKIADVPIAVNQIEFHPWYFREDLLDYCHEHDVVVEAAAPLARAQYLDDPRVVKAAEQHDVAPAQIVLKWAIEKGVVVLPKSTNPEHVASNIDLFGWELDDETIARLDEIQRMENVYMITPDHDTYGISP
ncbi:aldo/keto reductase [Halobellus ordinarius]|uniref:aldo/keto reductase n=1 Tax=Halobellus ordinarius TaxID=3075120 RepID=UPI00288077A8|nr:aldo/keto reductase [Halobellus sp. ZY16]